MNIPGSIKHKDLKLESAVCVDQVDTERLLKKIMYEEIDRTSPEILNALANAPLYMKKGSVIARPTVDHEQVATKLASGAIETINIAGTGDWVVTNPTGEQYVISSEKFFDRYEPTDTEGVYQANGYCRAILNPFGKPIKIMASWGSPQAGDENCLIVDTCDADGKNAKPDPYIVENMAFKETYKLK